MFFEWDGAPWMFYHLGFCPGLKKFGICGWLWKIDETGDALWRWEFRLQRLLLNSLCNLLLGLFLQACLHFCIRNRVAYGSLKIGRALYVLSSPQARLAGQTTETNAIMLVGFFPLFWETKKEREWKIPTEQLSVQVTVGDNHGDKDYAFIFTSLDTLVDGAPLSGSIPIEGVLILVKHDITHSNFITSPAFFLICYVGWGFHLPSCSVSDRQI